MRPKKPIQNNNQELFRSRLDQIINMKHELILLADRVDWGWLDSQVSPLFKEKGRPATPSRFILGLLLLKSIHNLSDEDVCRQWLQNPYFQYFTGESFFQHTFPHDRSSLTRWRQLLGDKVDILLNESLNIAHKLEILSPQDFESVTIDSTVQEKAVSFPTDAGLLEEAILRLGSAAKDAGVLLRQSYSRVSKTAAIMAGRYAHAKQHKRKNKQIKFLKVRLGRLLRDIKRKSPAPYASQTQIENLSYWHSRCHLLKMQLDKRMKRTIYSLTMPEVECIGKGKAKTPYEFGVKVGFITTNRPTKAGMFVLDATALMGKPYDGHTLRDALIRTQSRLAGTIKQVYADKGYRGHGIKVGEPNMPRIYLSGQKQGVFGKVKQELRRRPAIEPVIGHMKADGCLGRNFLKGHVGDQVNCVMAALGYNFRAIINWLRLILCLILISQFNKTQRA